MLATVEAMKKGFEDSNLKIKMIREVKDGPTIVYSGVNGKSNTYDILFIFTPDEHTVTIRVDALAKVPIDRAYDVRDQLNELNVHYRWIKLIINKDSDICLLIDAIVTPETAGPVCVELMVRTMKIVDEIYPVIMQSIWSK